MAYIGKAPSAVPITSADLADSIVTSAKIADGTIALADLSATGTKDATTFLRGDNSFAEAGGGSLVYLATASGSNVSSISLDGYFTSDYTHYKVFYTTVPNTNNTDSVMRFRQSNADVTSSIYYIAGTASYLSSSSTSIATNGAWGNSRFQISSSDQTSSSAYPTTGEMVLYNPLSTTLVKTLTTNNIGYNSDTPPSAIRNHYYAGFFLSTSAISGVTFFYEGGNITGTIYLYGIKNS